MKPPKFKAPKVLYFPYSTLLSRVRGHMHLPVLQWLLASIVGRTHYELLKVAVTKHMAKINQLKYHSGVN